MQHVSSMLVFATAVMVGGCVAPSTRSQADMALVKNVNTPLQFDDPLPVFEKLFPGLKGPLRKDAFEKSAEFSARLAATGLAGKEVVFFIPPELCEVVAYPDEDLYIVVSRDSYYRGPAVDNKPYGISVSVRQEQPLSYPAQNEYGVTATVTDFRDTILKICPSGLGGLPMSLKWTKGKYDSSFVHLGLPVRTADPAFRDLLRAKRLGLATKVKIGPFDKLDVYHDMSNGAT